ncbi:HD domain-containing protein [Flavobacterium bizetiae]|uniref:HD domain-containing protein n=1 Tax=Flavobacterium bizetiae TaxID=2704140 RepID=UPI0037563B2A
MNLNKIYSELLSNIGFSANDIQQNWLDLEKAYSGKSRHYHNLTHIAAMIESFETYRDKLDKPNEILFSIFYHDYIYKSSKKDNELKSAEFALSILPENSSFDHQLVFDAICATQLHQHNANEDINWLIDFDLKILARDWEDYKIYFEQIRKEYSIYPDFLYKPGRAKALKHFLENEFIFQTEEFRGLYEEKARINIEKEILLLT